MGSTSRTYASFCDSSTFIIVWSRDCGCGGHADTAVEDLLGLTLEATEAVALSMIAGGFTVEEAVSVAMDFDGEDLSGLLICCIG